MYFCCIFLKVVSTVDGLQTITEYTYDVNGNRISMSTNGQVTDFVNDTLSDLTMVLVESSSEKTVVYTYGNDIISMSVDAQDDMDTSYMRYYLTDGHGDVRQLADKWGIVTDEYTYDAYGMLLYHEGDSDNHMLYAGQQYDDSTGLYNMRARYMDPSTGRFLSMDTYQGSIWEPTSLHKYTYTSGNPVMYQDVSGYSEATISNSGAAMAINAIITTAVFDHMVLGMYSRIVESINAVPDELANELKNDIIGDEEDFRNKILIFVVDDYEWRILFGDPPEDIGWQIEILPLPQKVGIEIVFMEIFENPSIWDLILHISQGKGNDQKVTSASQMQGQVIRGRAPIGVDRVDEGHEMGGKVIQPHVHFVDGTSLNQDGTVHDKRKGTPRITKKIRNWLEDNGWKGID